MGLLERQVRRKTEEATLRLLRQGKVPDALRVSMEIAEFVRRADGGPTMRPRHQPRRTKWDIQKTNAVLKETKFDLDVCFDEVVGQVGRLLSRYSLVDLTYHAQRYELDALLSLLKNLAFTTKNLEDNFFGVFDTFDDLTKVDQSKSTRDVVDLNEGLILLPQNDVTGDRVDMSHLFGRKSWPISASAPDAPPAEPTDGPKSINVATEKSVRVVQNEPVPGTWFGNAFGDMLNTWRQIVTTASGAGCSIEFTVPLRVTDGDSVSISRIFLLPASVHEQEVVITHSFDGVNYVRFSNISDVISLQTGRGTSLDFETTRTRFVRFRVYLSEPTHQDGVSFSYVFGFRNISFYKLGRLQQAEMVSLALGATAMPKAIDKVAISTVEEIPANCDIAWFVAASDDDGNPRDGVWRPITPVSRAPLEGIPQVVKFAESATKRLDLPAPDPAFVHETVRDVPHYRITTLPLEDEPLFRQAFLYRGESAWWRNTQREVQTRQARDVFVDFNSGDIQRLYVVSTEVADLSTETVGSNQKTVLMVSTVIDYDVATMLLTPPADVDPEVDQRPRYAIYRVLRFRDRMTVTNEAIVLNGTSWTQLANSGIMAEGNGRPVVKNTAESVTYAEGTDYVLEEDQNTHKLTGRIRRIATTTQTSNISDGASVKVTYELDPDVTYLVDSVSGSKVVLSDDLGGPIDQHFQVTYRLVPRPPLNEVRKPTVHVSSQYGTAEGVVYEEGLDYIVDTVRGTITRVPAGNIKNELVAFVDFRYEQSPRDLDTFTTWVHIERRDPFVIEINPLGIDVEAGELVLIDGHDISTRTVFPELAFGWHPVTVRSKRPEAFTGAAIRRIAELRDRNGDAVFVAGGRFFSRMTASRIPLTQKTYDQLTRATARTDHGYFAVDLDHVVVNFEPGSTEEIYLYGQRYVAGVLTLGVWPEAFRLEYAYPLDTASPVHRILVRALLSRGENTDQGITPKAYEWHARLA